MSFSSLEEAWRVLGQWIEGDYNSALGYRSPEEFEGLYLRGKVSPPEADQSRAEGEVFPGGYSEMGGSEKIAYNAMGEVVF